MQTQMQFLQKSCKEINKSILRTLKINNIVLTYCILHFQYIDPDLSKYSSLMN